MEKILPYAAADLQWDQRGAMAPPSTSLLGII